MDLIVDYSRALRICWCFVLWTRGAAGWLCDISCGGRGCVGEERRLSLGEGEEGELFSSEGSELVRGTFYRDAEGGWGKGGGKKMRTCIDGFG